MKIASSPSPNGGGRLHLMRTRTLGLAHGIVGILLMVILASQLCAAQAAAPITERNILLIHGRSNSKNEVFGVLDHDQHNYWPLINVGTTGHVWYVQWDAWKTGFDQNFGNGGEAIVRNAINKKCNSANHQECWIICHSAGCAAFETYLAHSNYSSNPIFIGHVMAAGSAAGGSELANLAKWLLLGSTIGSGKINASLTTRHARRAYNHNNMQGVYVRAIGGTKPLAATACGIFPGTFIQVLPPPLGYSPPPYNQNCAQCVIDSFGTLFQYSVCSDGVVALHSSCGHNRRASFQDCNSRIPPHDDQAGTFEFHGWWINDDVAKNICNGQCVPSPPGPFSDTGKNSWNSTFHTYDVNHTAMNTSGEKALVIYEYSRCPSQLCP